MKIRSCAVLVMVLCLSCADTFAQDYTYNTSVTLEGVLVVPTADPEVTFCDKTHQFPSIKLLAPISVVCEPKDTGCLPEPGITLLHMVLKQPQLATFKKMKGKSAKVRGILRHADSGHDFTPVLMDVDAIAR